MQAARRLGGRDQELLLKEAMNNLWAYQRKHPNCDYYDYDDPSNTEAELIVMLKKPLGATILGEDYKGMEEMFSGFKRLLREEQHRFHSPVFPVLTLATTGKRGFVYRNEKGRLALLRLDQRLEPSVCFINGVDKDYAHLNDLAAEVVEVSESNATGKLHLVTLTQIGPVEPGVPMRVVLLDLATKNPQVLAAVLNDHTILVKDELEE